MGNPPSLTVFVQLVTGQLSDRNLRDKALLAKILDESPNPLVPLRGHSTKGTEVVDSRRRLSSPSTLE